MPRPPSTDLPVEAGIADLRAALAGPGHAVLEAPPGAGKTTIVPLRLLDERWLGGERIVVLEPRRLATRAAARRMASLLGEDVGATVGYRTRDERQVGPGTRIEVVTEGILTRRLQRDPSLPGVGLVVFDEVHERNLHADLALALLLDARPALRPDLRVLAMSATADTARIARLLGGDGEPSPIVTSEGRAHPIDVRWRPVGPRQRPAEAVAAAVHHALRTDDGDVLVFLAGAADIRRVQGLLVPTLRGTEVDVRPLFGALALAEQEAALAPSPAGRRRVVLTTDIAETSLTVEGIRVVIDSGEVRRPRYDARSGLTRLRTGATSRASADQRAGRAGRTAPGTAYRLWSKVDHAARRAHPEPEITAVDLAGLALELAVWGADPAELSFLDPPPPRTLAEGRALLADLGALDADGRVTPVGRAMAELPVHPRLARMVVGATARGARDEACALAALLEERDVLRGHPDERPVDVAARSRLVLDAGATDPAADRAAVQAVRRRARELARRVAGSGTATSRPAPGRRPRPAPSALAAASAPGALLALAYPDRLAQARGGGRFRLRTGVGAWLPAGDALTAEAFLVVAELADGRGTGRGPADHRVLLAAAIDEHDVEAVAGDAVEEVTTLAWDPDRDDLRVRSERRLGALLLATRDRPAEPGPATQAALLDHIRARGLGELRWTGAARALQARVAFARQATGAGPSPGGDRWPDLSDTALLADLDDWLGPVLHRAVGRAGLAAVDVAGALANRVGHHRLVDLDRLVPRQLTIASGRTVPIDYQGDAPTVAVRAQELYGTTTHPTIAGGRVPVVVQVLSPAGRPVQVTADLPGFWAGSWAAVRKDMAGRYPKHDWPADPTTAPPRRPRPPRSR